MSQLTTEQIDELIAQHVDPVATYPKLHNFAHAVADLVSGRGGPEISTEHGPWLPSQYHEDETYCQRCLTRSIFRDKRPCNPHIVHTETKGKSAPFGRVTVVKRPGCEDTYFFYPGPQSPYLDNAAECHEVYLAPPANSREVEAAASDATGMFAINVEKLLCQKIGREWTPTGVSITSLIDELAAQRPPSRLPSRDAL